MAFAQLIQSLRGSKLAKLSGSVRKEITQDVKTAGHSYIWMALRPAHMDTTGSAFRETGALARPTDRYQRPSVANVRLLGVRQS